MIAAKKLRELSAVEAARAVQSGAITVEDLAKGCIERINERDQQVGAWAFLDPDRVLAAARALDRSPQRGPLHGVPVGIKDVIDTAEYPTEYNSPIFRQHRPIPRTRR
jgi:Asp-tRNA(Asn)/Glu-tRNA(Gln) amidotransferase A subunit family amidase